MDTQKLQTRETSGSSLDTGRQRKVNQDFLTSAKIGRATSTSDEPFCLYVVADGMGVHEAGELASQTATEAAVEAFEAAMFCRQAIGHGGRYQTAAHLRHAARNF